MKRSIRLVLFVMAIGFAFSSYSNTLETESSNDVDVGIDSHSFDCTTVSSYVYAVNPVRLRTLPRANKIYVGNYYSCGVKKDIKPSARSPSLSAFRK